MLGPSAGSVAPDVGQTALTSSIFHPWWKTSRSLDRHEVSAPGHCIVFVTSRHVLWRSDSLLNIQFDEVVRRKVADVKGCWPYHRNQALWMRLLAGAFIQSEEAKNVKLRSNIKQRLSKRLCCARWSVSMCSLMCIHVFSCVFTFFLCNFPTSGPKNAPPPLQSRHRSVSKTTFLTHAVNRVVVLGGSLQWNKRVVPPQQARPAVLRNDDLWHVAYVAPSYLSHAVRAILLNWRQSMTYLLPTSAVIKR